MMFAYGQHELQSHYSTISVQFRLMDLHAIWQVQLWDPVPHCVRWASLTSHGKWKFGVEPPARDRHRSAILCLTELLWPLVACDSYYVVYYSFKIFCLLTCSLRCASCVVVLSE